MRARVVTLVLMLVLGMIALAPHAVGQEEPDSELSKLIRSFRDAQVAGDRVVVTDTPTPVNPFGGDVGLPTDVTDTISVVRSTEFVINGGPPYTTFDPMATDILYSTPRDGMVDLHEIMPSIPQNWVPLSVPDGFVTVEQALAYMFTGRIFPADFLEQFAAGEPIAIDGMVLTPPAGGVTPPLDQPWMIRGQAFASPLPPGYCDGSLLEMFWGDAMPGAPTWEPADFAPNDTFTGLSQAHVSRCVDGQIFPTQLLVNNGTNFQPQPTHAMSVWTPEAVFQIVPYPEVLGSEGHRSGAFYTDASNPFQPTNSAFTTSPPFPELAPGGPPGVFIEHPWSPVTIHPIALDFGDGSDGTPGFQNNFGVMVDAKDESGEIDEFSVEMIQFDKYHLTLGTLTYDQDAGTLSGVLSGSGDNYSESYDWTDEVYTLDNGTVEEFEYDVMIESATAALIAEIDAVYEERLAAVPPETTTTTEEPATTTSTSPADNPEEPVDLSTGGINPWVWLIVLGVAMIVAGFIWWLLLGAKKKSPCDELYQKWQTAKELCERLTKEAAAKRQAADDATKTREKAEKAKDDHCEKFPPACGPDASITDVGTGRTLTRDDLFVQRAWAADAWAGYKDRSKSAQETQDQWDAPPTKEFRDKALKDLADAKAATPGLEKAIADAEAAETKANDAADAAEKAADKACEDAKDAKAAYDECIQRNKDAEAAAASAAAAGAAIGGVGGAVMAGGVPPAGGDPCAPQQAAYDAAKAECDKQTAASQKAQTEADAAKAQLTAAEKTLAEIPGDAWIEESGKPETRITSIDLRVREAWAEKVWGDYQSDDISAQEASDRWGQKPPEDFAAPLENDLKAKVAGKPAAEQAVKDAKAKADAAADAASNAAAAAKAACTKADEAKKALDLCKNQ